MAKREFNTYYVVKPNLETGNDGLYKGKLLGTNPNKNEIYSNKVLYKGTNPKIANKVYRENSSSQKFDSENPSIYVGVNDTDKIVLHKA